MSPETAMMVPWRNLFSNREFKKLAIIAVDEAHCIVEWLGVLSCIHCLVISDDHCLLTRGKKFRTAFSELGGLRALVKTPVIALTASATPAIEKAIIDSLELRNAIIVRQELDRRNIFLSVCKKKGMNVSRHNKCRH